MDVLHEFEHELSVAVPSATQKAIDRFKELNDSALENMRNKFSDIRTIIVDGLDAGIKSFSNLKLINIDNKQTDNIVKKFKYIFAELYFKKNPTHLLYIYSHRLKSPPKQNKKVPQVLIFQHQRLSPQQLI